MAEQVFPTKGNLINTKKSLRLARLGYELLDRKRNILIRELMTMVNTVKSIRGSIEETYNNAYAALQEANITMGVIENIAHSIPVEDSVTVTYRSVMGCELPQVTIKERKPTLDYGFAVTNSRLDYAYICFEKVKQMTAVLAEVENCVYRLAVAIKKTQTRANALKNIVIPKFELTVWYISNSLEEKEREEFSRLKVIKHQKNKAKEAEEQ